MFHRKKRKGNYMDVSGVVRFTEETLKKAIAWMKENRFNYKTEEELLRDYFLTFPEEFDTGSFEVTVPFSAEL